MNTWFEYRTVWINHPWMVAVAVLGALLLVLGIVGTVVHNGFALLFIPGIGVLFAHHFLAMRRLG